MTQRTLLSYLGLLWKMIKCTYVNSRELLDLTLTQDKDDTGFIDNHFKSISLNENKWIKGDICILRYLILSMATRHGLDNCVELDRRKNLVIETWWRHDMETLPALMVTLWGESTNHRWISLTKDQWYGALMFPCCSLEITVDKTVKLPMIGMTLL